MNLRGIVAVSGKPGLFKAISQNKAGFILETLDEQKAKVVTGPTARLAALEEITVYGYEEDFKLKDIFSRIEEAKGVFPMPSTKSSNEELKSFFTKILPGHDQERVYVSDIKKILSWYLILVQFPLFTEADPAEEAEKAAE